VSSGHHNLLSENGQPSPLLFDKQTTNFISRRTPSSNATPAHPESSNPSPYASQMPSSQISFGEERGFLQGWDFTRQRSARQLVRSSQPRQQLLPVTTPNYLPTLERLLVNLLHNNIRVFCIVCIKIQKEKAWGSTWVILREASQSAITSPCFADTQPKSAFQFAVMSFSGRCSDSKIFLRRPVYYRRL